MRRCRVGTRRASRLRRPLRSRGAPPGREAQRPLLLLRMPLLLAAAAAAEWTSLAVGARAQGACDMRARVIPSPRAGMSGGVAQAPSSAARKRPGGCRFDSSLGLLTKRFMTLLQVRVGGAGRARARAWARGTPAPVVSVRPRPVCACVPPCASEFCVPVCGLARVSVVAGGVIDRSSWGGACHSFIMHSLRRRRAGPWT